MPPLLPYGRQSIDDDDIAAVVGVLRSDWLAHGPRVGAFERAFAETVGATEAVACSSGTAALHLALAALDVGPRDVCVVPAITFLATASAVRFCGAQVVFADVDVDTGLMTPDTLAEALARAPGPVRAVLPVHLAGRFCDTVVLAGIARRHGAVLVEDSCHAVGGTDGEGYAAGACIYSAAATFSFHPVKTLAAGEGGMVTLNDPARAERMRRLRNHGVTRDPASMTRPFAFDGAGAANPWAAEQTELGFNYRMDEMSAALGASQLTKLARFAERRQALAALYDAALAPLAPRLRPVPTPPGQRPCLHLYTVLIDFEAPDQRAELMRALAADGVGTQVHYVPLYRQPGFDPDGTASPLPGAEAYYRRVLALPLFPAMADGDVDRVAEALARHLDAIGAGSSTFGRDNTYTQV